MKSRSASELRAFKKKYRNGEALPGVPSSIGSSDAVGNINAALRRKEEGLDLSSLDLASLEAHRRILAMEEENEAVEQKRPIAEWAKPILASMRPLQRMERQAFAAAAMCSDYAEAEDSKASGKEGGDTANLTGDEKALHLARSIRKRSPSLSDRALAEQVKKQGGSSVSNGAETLRKKVAEWVRKGVIPAGNGTAGRKPKRGRTSR